MNTALSSRAKRLGLRLGNGFEVGFRRIFDLIALVALVWWLKPLTYVPGLRRLVRQTPNVLSGLRLALSIPYACLLYNAVVNRHAAWTWLGIGAGLALLDAIDGPLARRLDAMSTVGKGLDPIADKALFGSLVVAFWWLTLWHVSIMAGLIFMVPMLWSFNVERHLIVISLPTRRVCEQLGVEVPGANRWGKIKFNLQILAIGGGWIFFVHAPHDPTSYLWTLVLLFPARFFADKSLGQHRRELRQFQEQAAGNKLVHLPQEYSA